jgi:hypothetical protein
MVPEFEDRFVLEDDSRLGHSPDVAGEAHAGPRRPATAIAVAGLRLTQCVIGIRAAGLAGTAFASGRRTSKMPF